MLDWQQRPHARLNLLTGDWILVSPHRTQRPWQGQVEKSERLPSQPFDPSCYLCPGNVRAGGHRNPPYSTTFAFDNDYPALIPDVVPARMNEKDLLIAETEPGIARVMCFSPIHDLTIAQMDQTALAQVVEAWCVEDEQLSAREMINYVQIFENRGQMMGASNPHPHCQIWACHRIPDEIRHEENAQREWMEHHGDCLLCSYLDLERGRERVVAENDEFVAVVPFWAVWPFETLILSRRHCASMRELTVAEQVKLADILQQITIRYDNLFEAPAAYSMGFHQSPVHSQYRECWHFHAHFYPPMLRSATVRKFMVGFELLAMPQRDITAESAAERLRSLSPIHYTRR